jgi:hypothetical protein
VARARDGAKATIDQIAGLSDEFRKSLEHELLHQRSYRQTQAMVHWALNQATDTELCWIIQEVSETCKARWFATLVRESDAEAGRLLKRANRSRLTLEEKLCVYLCKQQDDLLQEQFYANGRSDHAYHFGIVSLLFLVASSALRTGSQVAIYLSLAAVAICMCGIWQLVLSSCRMSLDHYSHDKDRGYRYRLVVRHVVIAVVALLAGLALIVGSV